MSVAPKFPVSVRSVASRRSSVTALETVKNPAKSGSAARSRTERRERLVARSAQLRNLPAATDQKSEQPTRAVRETDGKMPQILPQTKSMPVWLVWLLSWQRFSSAIMFLLVGGTLAVYGGTVYTQQLWSKEYRKLETLQRQERQLTAAGEVLKNKLADQAEQPGTGMVAPTPSHTLFLEPTPQAAATTEATPPSTPASEPTLSPTPMGY